MKSGKFIIALLIAACSFGLLSFVPPTPPSGPAVVVKKGKVKINKIVVNADWSITTFKAALGEPDRAGGTSNKVHVYDTKCIGLYEGYDNGGPSGIVKEFKMYYKLVEDGEYIPTGDGFTGTIKIDKLTVTKDLTPGVVRQKLSKWTESNGYTSHVYRFENAGVYVYFGFSDDEKSLHKVSIGPDKN